jgi:plastocyanin
VILEDDEMKNRSRVPIAGAAVLAFACACASVSIIAAPRAARGEAADSGGAPPDMTRLQGEVNRLKQEVREQRQLIFQLMQVEQQHYEMLLKYLNSGVSPSGDTTGELPAAPVVPRAAPGGAKSSAGEARETSDGSAPIAAGVAAPARELGTISGRVRAGGPVADVYVYVDGLRAAPARNHKVEIKQQGKQFSPRVSVVPLGTRVIFPNDDTVIHNVFSQNPGNSFDLGSIKSGEKTNPVALLKPGHVEVFCNIHSKMRADILVVPNTHWTRVGTDGSFQIPNVPAGTRRVVLWSPGLKPVSQEVEVTAKGGSVTFAAEKAASRPHFNKRGQVYGSYDE